MACDMDQAKYDYINRLAEDVLDEYRIQIPIRNIDTIVEQMGGRIEDLEFRWDETYIKREGQQSFCIAVARDQMPEHRLIQIAAELGHLFLHFGFRTDWELWESIEVDKPYTFSPFKWEFKDRPGDFNCRASDEAWAFAYAFLMPTEDYAIAIEKCDMDDHYVDMQKMADYFGLTPNVVIRQGKMLGFLERSGLW